MLKFFNKSKKQNVILPRYKISIEEYKEKIGSLTNQEEKVYNEVVQGYTTLEIAKKLNLTINTINSYMKSIFKKLDVHSKVELIVTYGNIFNILNDIDIYD